MVQSLIDVYLIDGRNENELSYTSVCNTKCIFIGVFVFYINLSDQAISTPKDLANLAILVLII